MGTNGRQSWICHEECQDDENEKSDICFVRETNVGVQYFFVLSPSLDRESQKRHPNTNSALQSLSHKD